MRKEALGLWYGVDIVAPYPEPRCLLQVTSGPLQLKRCGFKVGVSGGNAALCGGFSFSIKELIGYWPMSCSASKEVLEK